MKDDVPGPPPSRLRPLLRRLDQACVGTVLGLSLAAIALWWFSKGGHRGGLIEIDQAEPGKVDFQLDINTADWPELTMLPGVGQTLAQRIVQWREQNGPFVDNDDLLRVPGIGPKTLRRIRPYLLPISDPESAARR